MGTSKPYCGSEQVMLIRRIQEGAGERPCYATVERKRCSNTHCCWRSDCYCDDECCPSDGVGELNVRESRSEFYQARG